MSGLLKDVLKRFLAGKPLVSEEFEPQRRHGYLEYAKTESEQFITELLREETEANAGGKTAEAKSLREFRQLIEFLYVQVTREQSLLQP